MGIPGLNSGATTGSSGQAGLGPRTGRKKGAEGWVRNGCEADNAVGLLTRGYSMPPATRLGGRRCGYAGKREGDEDL